MGGVHFFEVVRGAFLSILALCTIGCVELSNRGANVVEEAEIAVADSLDYTARSLFQPTLPPAELDAEAQREFLREHYWDRLDFSDSLFFERLDTMQMLRAYSLYVGSILQPTDSEAMRMLMLRASRSKVATRWLFMLGQRVLYDAASPLRCDELYIPVAESIVEGDLLSEEERSVAKYQLELLLRNRVGEVATNFSYYLEDGLGGELHSIECDWLLLFISNPDCPMCEEVAQGLQESPLINEMVERGELKILMLYPDEDLQAWRRARHKVPKSWIYGYDKGARLFKERLYDMRAIPSLYLLDRSKRVVLKDAVLPQVVEQELHNRR